MNSDPQHFENPANAEIQQSWAHIVSLSDQLMSLADQQEWLAMVEQAAERHNAVQQHFEQFPVGPETAAYYVDKLNGFMTQEQQLQNLAREARKFVMKQGADIQLGKKMTSAYTR